MPNYRLKIQYDGGRYKGWQRLGNVENTIQGKLESVLTEMVGEDTEIIGSSRTDAGVHAFGQIANFRAKRNFSEEELMEYFNRYLPDDISVVAVDTVSDRFHSRYNAKSKTYLRCLRQELILSVNMILQPTPTPSLRRNQWLGR